MDSHEDQQFLETVVTSLVDNPDAVKIDRTVDEMGVLLTLDVHAEDMRKIRWRERLVNGDCLGEWCVKRLSDYRQVFYAQFGIYRVYVHQRHTRDFLTSLAQTYQGSERAICSAVCRDMSDTNLMRHR
ncbi:hypothetical protein N9L26_02375 [Candidatus Pacebacteria bacterium]|nr:hypothetical protein [Candidatus Paceibacterota bacterium]